jgi:hypothetical protein
MRTLSCDVDGQFVSDEECRDCAIKRLKHTDPTGVERHCSNPTPYIMFITRKDESRKHAGVSATMLSSGCYRQSIWQVIRDYSQSPRELAASVHGTMMHDQLQQYTEAGTVAEDRFYTHMPSGRLISGQIDRYLPEHLRIEDYKIKEKRMYRAPENYIAQLNIYRYMIVMGAIDRETGIVTKGEVEELSLYIGGHTPWQEVPLPVWGLAFAEEYIETGLDIFDRMHEPGFVPPRGLDPHKDKLCLDWCPFNLVCQETGGPLGHPMLTMKGV